MSIDNIKTIAAFLIVVLIWSTTPLAIQWSSGNTPQTSVLIRMIIGVICCFVLMVVLNISLPNTAKTRQMYALSGLSIFIPMSLFYLAAQTIPSGWIAVLFGLSPLFTGLFSAIIEPESRLTSTRILGLLLGLTGLYLVFSGGLSFVESSLKGIVLTIIAVLVASASSVAIRHVGKTTDLQGMQITTGGLLVAIPCFTIAAWLTESPTDVSFSVKESLSILYLGLIGTGVGFTLYYYLLKKVSANRVAMITLVTPITALGLGSWLNSEPLVADIWLGAALVCSGLILYEFKPKFGMRKL